MVCVYSYSLSATCSLFSCRKPDTISSDDPKVPIRAESYDTPDFMYDDLPLLYVYNSNVTDQQIITGYINEYDVAN